MIAGSYYFYLGDLKSAIETGEHARQVFPRESFIRTNLGSAYVTAGRYEDALAESREVVRLDPTSVLRRNNMAVALMRLNRFEEAKKVVLEARDERLDSAIM